MLQQTLTYSGGKKWTSGRTHAHMQAHGYRHTDMCPYEQLGDIRFFARVDRDFFSCLCWLPACMYASCMDAKNHTLISASHTIESEFRLAYGSEGGVTVVLCDTFEWALEPGPRAR